MNVYLQISSLILAVVGTWLLALGLKVRKDETLTGIVYWEEHKAELGELGGFRKVSRDDPDKTPPPREIHLANQVSVAIWLGLGFVTLAACLQAVAILLVVPEAG